MPETLPINQWAEDDRPREKLLHKGPQSLSDAELIALLLGSGSPLESAVHLAQRLLNHHNRDLDLLGQCSPEEFSSFKGIGRAKAVRLLGALELGRRMRNGQRPGKATVSGSKDAYDVLHPQLAHLDHEQFCVLFLSSANEVIRLETLSKGGWTGTVADVRPIFRRALELKATALIVAHNHPSGQLRPSTADKQLTDRLKQAGQFMDISLLDHLIVTSRGYYSFADEGLL